MVRRCTKRQFPTPPSPSRIRAADAQKSVALPFLSQSPKRVGSGRLPPLVGPPHSMPAGPCTNMSSISSSLGSFSGPQDAGSLPAAAAAASSASCASSCMTAAWPGSADFILLWDILVTATSPGTKGLLALAGVPALVGNVLELAARKTGSNGLACVDQERAISRLMILAWQSIQIILLPRPPRQIISDTCQQGIDEQLVYIMYFKYF